MLTKEAITQLLATNDKALCRALVLLNERQTVDEQASEATRYHNGRGFRPCHAKMGTSMATFFTRRGYLSPKQLAYWRKPMKDGNMKIGIYWKQLQEEAEKKAAKAEPVVIIYDEAHLIHDAVLQVAEDLEQKRLEIAVSEVLDSDDEKMIEAAQNDLDKFMEKVRARATS